MLVSPYSVQNEVDASDLHTFHKPLASRLLESLSCNLSWITLFERCCAATIAPSADADAPIQANYITPTSLPPPLLPSLCSL